jgi:hypothetical protein
MTDESTFNLDCRNWEQMTSRLRVGLRRTIVQLKYKLSEFELGKLKTEELNIEQTKRRLAAAEQALQKIESQFPEYWKAYRTSVGACLAWMKENPITNFDVTAVE